MADATFDIDDWNESPIDDDAPRITQVIATKSFSGEIKGHSTISYTMAYGEDGSALVLGIERLAATIGTRSGTLVLRHVGRFADGAATSDIEVVAAYGTDDFAGVAGTGGMRADPSGSMKLDLEE